MNKIAWLIYDKQSAIKNKYFIESYIAEAKKISITMKLILIEELEFGVLNNKWIIKYNHITTTKPSFAIVRLIYPLLSEQLECMNIPVFNNAKIARICNDKAKTYQYVAQLNIPMIDTIFVKNSLKTDITNIKELNNSLIIKAVAGHGGSQVFKVNSIKEYEECIETLKGEDYVIQPLIGKSNKDLRVYILGNEILAAVLRSAKEGFKSNYSLGGEVCLYSLSEKEKELVTKIISLFDFDLVGIDFLIGDDGEFIFNEIEDVVGARMLYKCMDINLTKLHLKHIIKKLKCI